MTAPTEQPVEAPKVRLDEEQMETLRQALVVAAHTYRAAADLAQIAGDSFVAGLASDKAREFEELLEAGQGITRITVRF